jgi:hypothetical protein
LSGFTKRDKRAKARRRGFGEARTRLRVKVNEILTHSGEDGADSWLRTAVFAAQHFLRGLLEAQGICALRPFAVALCLA